MSLSTFCPHVFGLMHSSLAVPFSISILCEQVKTRDQMVSLNALGVGRGDGRLFFAQPASSCFSPFHPSHRIVENPVMSLLAARASLRQVAIRRTGLRHSSGHGEYSVSSP